MLGAAIAALALAATIGLAVHHDRSAGTSQIDAAGRSKSGSGSTGDDAAGGGPAASRVDGGGNGGSAAGLIHSGGSASGGSPGSGSADGRSGGPGDAGSVVDGGSESTTTSVPGTTTPAGPTTTQRPLPTTAPPTTRPTTDPQPYDSPYFLMGYLWGDGEPQAGGGWHWRSSQQVLVEQFRAAADAAHVSYTEVANGDYTAFAVKAVPFPLDKEGTPPALSGAGDGAVKAFLAAVIEGEGSHDGLVVDDPGTPRIDVMSSLLGGLGVHTALADSSSAFHRLFARQADWPIVQRFPYVAYGRVPGGPPT